MDAADDPYPLDTFDADDLGLDRGSGGSEDDSERDRFGSGEEEDDEEDEEGDDDLPAAPRGQQRGRSPAAGRRNGPAQRPRVAAAAAADVE